MIEIIEIAVDKCGVLCNKKVNFKNGLNIVYGLNEAGKSTLQFFIRALFYGVPNKGNDCGADRLPNGKRVPVRKRFLSNDSDVAKGTMVFKWNEIIYRAQVCFGSRFAYDEIKVIDNLNGTTVFEVAFGKEIFGIPETSFAKSMWIGQGALYMGGEDGDISKKLSGLALSGEEEINMVDVSKRFEEAKRKINKTANMRKFGRVDELKARRDKIRKLKPKVDECWKLKNELEKLFVEREKAEDKKIIDEYRTFEELNEEIKKNADKPEVKFFESRSEAQLAQVEKSVAKLSELEEQQNRWNFLDAKNDGVENKIRKTFWYDIILTLAFIIILVCFVLYFFSPDLFKRFFVSQNYFFIATGVLGSLFTLLLIGKIIHGVTERKKIKFQIENDKDFDLKRKKNDDEKTKLKNYLNTEFYKPLEVIGYEGFVEKKNAANELIIKINRDKNAFNKFLNGRHYDKIAERVLVILRKYPDIAKDEIKDITELNEKTKALTAQVIELENEIKSLYHSLPNSLDVDCELQEIENNIQSYNKKYEALIIAESAMKKIFQNARNHYEMPINQQVNKIISTITNGKYTDLKINDVDYSITLLTEYGIVDADSLSLGTYDQVYFAVRMALAELLCPDNRIMFLDEPFCRYDDARIKAVFDYLREISQKTQVILFTCQKRDCDIARNFANVIEV